MKLLYIAMAHDYGSPDAGPSFEEVTFRSALEGMGHELVRFDPLQRRAAVGRRRANAELVALAREEQPDAVFSVLYEDEVSTSTLDRLREIAPTLNWFTDDHWRFETFSRHYARHLDWAITTDPDAPPRYAAHGITNVIVTQWACNRYAYHRTATTVRRGVTFVGLPHGDRPAVIQRLRDAGVTVETFGTGWPAGRVDHETMIHLFGSSAINLNLSNSSTFEPTLRMRLGAIVRAKPLPPTGLRPSQIKGRTFEVPGCGGFLLTDRVRHLERYFSIGEEIATFSGVDDLIEQVKHWLARPEERAAIAEAGYRRVVAEHTYDHRFDAIFAQARLI